MAVWNARNVAPTWASMPGKVCSAAAATGFFLPSACRKLELMPLEQGPQDPALAVWASACHQAVDQAVVKTCDRC
jgi:hypothetical protein